MLIHVNILYLVNLQFRFSDVIDKVLMIVGTIAACSHGVAVQSNLLILSATLDLYANATIEVE